MKRVLAYLFVILCGVALLHAQDAGATFQFLQLPVSSHAAALGGDSAELRGEAFPARFSTAPTVLTSWTSTGILVPNHYFPHWKQWSINKRKSCFIRM